MGLKFGTLKIPSLLPCDVMVVVDVEGDTGSGLGLYHGAFLLATDSSAER